MPLFMDVPQKLPQGEGQGLFADELYEVVTMTRLREVIVLIGAGLVLIVATVALAASGKGELTELKQATAGCHNLDKAIALPGVSPR